MENRFFIAWDVGFFFVFKKGDVPLWREVFLMRLGPGDSGRRMVLVRVLWLAWDVFFSGSNFGQGWPQAGKKPFRLFAATFIVDFAFLWRFNILIFIINSNII